MFFLGPQDAWTDGCATNDAQDIARDINQAKVLHVGNRPQSRWPNPASPVLRLFGFMMPRVLPRVLCGPPVDCSHRSVLFESQNCVCANVTSMQELVYLYTLPSSSTLKATCLFHDPHFVLH